MPPRRLALASGQGAADVRRAVWRAIDMARFFHPLGAVILVLLAPCPAQAQAPRAKRVDEVARDIGRLESLRAVKDLQRSYAQYAQFGLWSEMADLFASSGKIVWGDEVVVTRPELAKWLARHGAP